VVSLLSTESLEALPAGLVADDARLIQGGDDDAAAVAVRAGLAGRGACGLATAAGRARGWRRWPRSRSSSPDVARDRPCAGEPAGCRWFLNWFDETPRDDMRRECWRSQTAPWPCGTPTIPAEGRRRQQRNGRRVTTGDERTILVYKRPLKENNHEAVVPSLQKVKSNRPRGLCWSCY